MQSAKPYTARHSGEKRRLVYHQEEEMREGTCGTATDGIEMNAGIEMGREVDDMTEIEMREEIEMSVGIGIPEVIGRIFMEEMKGERRGERRGEIGMDVIERVETEVEKEIADETTDEETGTTQIQEDTENLEKPKIEAIAAITEAEKESLLTARDKNKQIYESIKINIIVSFNPLYKKVIEKCKNKRN